MKSTYQVLLRHANKMEADIERHKLTYETHSEAWQEGSKGEQFQEMIEDKEEVHDALRDTLELIENFNKKHIDQSPIKKKAHEEVSGRGL